MLLAKIKNAIKEKMAGTVFADAAVNMKYLYKKGAKLLVILFLFSY